MEQLAEDKNRGSMAWRCWQVGGYRYGGLKPGKCSGNIMAGEENDLHFDEIAIYVDNILTWFSLSTLTF